MSYENRGVSHARGYLGIVNVRCDRCHHDDDLDQLYGNELDGTRMDHADIHAALCVVRRDAAKLGWTVPPEDERGDVLARDYCADCTVAMR